MARKYRITLALLLLSTLSTLFAQAPDVPKPKIFDTQTRIELGVIAATLAADGYTTVLNSNPTSHEINPIARVFLGDRQQHAVEGESALAAISFTATVGGNYLLRRHSKWRHTLNWSIIAGESLAIGYNVSQHRK